MWIKPTEANDKYARVFEASTKEFGTHGDDWWSAWPEIAVAVGKGDWDTAVSYTHLRYRFPLRHKYQLRRSHLLRKVPLQNLLGMLWFWYKYEVGIHR